MGKARISRRRRDSNWRTRTPSSPHLLRRIPFRWSRPIRGYLLFSHVSLRLADAKDVLSLIVIVLPWNSGPLCLAQNGIMNHDLSLPFSFWTCAPTVGAHLQSFSEQSAGHFCPFSLYVIQWFFHDPQTHSLSDVPFMLCTCIVSPFRCRFNCKVVHQTNLSITLQSLYFFARQGHVGGSSCIIHARIHAGNVSQNFQELIHSWNYCSVDTKKSPQ